MVKSQSIYEPMGGDNSLDCNIWHKFTQNLYIFISIYSTFTQILSTLIEKGHILAFNSSPPSVTYICQWTGSALVQIMACLLIGAKPLSKPVQGYGQVDP